jgi:hypothetical protein
MTVLVKLLITTDTNGDASNKKNCKKICLQEGRNTVCQNTAPTTEVAAREERVPPSRCIVT